MLNRSFLLRFISGICIISVFVISIRGPSLLFFSLMLVVSIFMIKEWFFITYPNIYDIIIGSTVIFFSILSLVIVKLFSARVDILLWYFVVIWTFDTMAMVGGKFIGGKKIAEKISPMKTWSGALSGVVFASIASSLICNFLDLTLNSQFSIFKYGDIFACILVCIFAHLGDFFESYYKRKHNVKDSGKIIPGHGGVLDRFDSLIFSAPLLFMMMKF